MPRISSANISTRAFPLPGGGAGGDPFAVGQAVLESLDLWMDAATDLADLEDGDYTSSSGHTFTVGNDGTGSFDPLIVKAGDAGLVFFNGTTAYDHLYAAHRAGIMPTGDFEIRALVTPESFSSSGTIISKDGTTGMELATVGTGALQVSWGGVTATSNINILPMDTMRWVRATVDVTTGSAYEVNFYYSDQTSQFDPDLVTWTHHTTATGGDGTAVPTDSGAADWTFGWRGYDAGGSLGLRCRLHQVQVKDGIGGTTVLRMNAQAADHDSWTDPYGNVYQIGKSLGGAACTWVKPNACFALFNDNNSSFMKFVDTTLTRPASGEATYIWYGIHRPVGNTVNMMSSVNTTATGGRYWFQKTDAGQINTTLYSGSTNTLDSGSTTDLTAGVNDFLFVAIRFATDGTVSIRHYVNDGSGVTDTNTVAGIAGETYLKGSGSDIHRIGNLNNGNYSGDCFAGIGASYDTAISDLDLDAVAAKLRSVYT